MAVVLEEKWPVLGRHARAAEWLGVWADLGRAPGTIDAYGRGLAEYLQVCERDGVDPLAATRAQVGAFVRELTSRPSRRGVNVVALDSGAGLANATLQQRLVPVRLFYDFLVEEGLRESNPVGRGSYTPGRHFGGHGRSVVPRMVKLPWIPGEAEWLQVLGVFRDELVRNRVMLALAYDAALRREELCSLRTDDLDPAHRMLRGAGGDDQDPAGADGAVLGADRGASVGVPAAPGHAQPCTGAFVLVGVAAQPGGAADVVDLVKSGAAGGTGGWGAAVFHPHHAAPVPDGPGPDGLGAARDRDVRGASLHRLNASLYPSVRAGAVGEAEFFDGAYPRVAGRDAYRA